MVKIKRTPTAPASLAVEKAKGTANYRSEDVIRQLHQDFHGKCYLCEIDELQSIQVEHLKAHHNGQNRDLMFDWNNLFYSCAHCNNVKNTKQYEDSILDCCQVEPEAYIQQELINSHVRVAALDDSHTARMTAKLITECFEKTNTGIRTLECKTRVDALQKTMAVLYRNLELYQKEPTARTLRVLRGMLNRSYKFAGFTRTYVRQHIDEYPELAPFVKILQIKPFTISQTGGSATEPPAAWRDKG